MTPKTYDKLARVTYSDGFPVSPRMIASDYNDYALPLEKLVHKSLHGGGVASGLEVTATSDGAGVQVAPGVAITRGGRLIVLATGGHAALGSQSPLTATSVPSILLPADNHKGKIVAVTIQFNELPKTNDNPADFPAGRFEHSPWLMLIPVADFADNDDVVVLAFADIDAAGKVASVASQAAGSTPARQRLGATFGQIAFERPGPTASETAMGSIGPLPTATGLQIAAESACVAGKFAVAPGVGARPLIALSSTPGGGGGVETTDANGKRMVALTTSGAGAQQAGYVSVAAAAGAELVALSANAAGAGQVQVQTPAGKAAVVLTTAGPNNDGLIRVVANAVDVITLGAGGINTQGGINTSGSILATGGITCHAGFTTQGGISASGNISSSGTLFGNGCFLANGAVSGTGWGLSAGGLTTNGSIQCTGTAFIGGNVQPAGHVFATEIHGRGSVFTDGQVVAKGTVFSDQNMQAKGSLFTAGQVVAQGAIFANGELHAKGIIFGEGNVQSKANIFADGQIVAKGDIFGKAKHFVMTHPKDGSKVIIYGCLEGPEAAAYLRGRGKLKDGKATIALPEHFQLVINPDTATIQLTPRSAASKGLAIAASNAEGFTVQELASGTGSYDFDYFIAGVRQGYENYQPVVGQGTGPLSEASAPSSGLASAANGLMIPVPAAAMAAQPETPSKPSAADGVVPWDLI